MAHLEKVVKTYPIDGADAVEMCQILDYHVVVQKKHNFQKNDLVVYIEVDSQLPDGLPAELVPRLKELNKAVKKAPIADQEKMKEEISSILSQNVIPEFEFLRAKDFEIHAMKFGKLGVYSLGIIFPIDVAHSFIQRLPVDSSLKTIELKAGADLTDLLQITKLDDGDDVAVDNTPKYLKSLDRKLQRFEAYRRAKKWYKKHCGLKLSGEWPSILPNRSSEDNIQAVFSRLVRDRFNEERLVVTEKLEGQNISIFTRETKLFGLFKRKTVGVCSHNRYIRSPDGSGFWETVQRLGIDKRLKDIPGEWFIRGEHCGPGVAAGAANIYEFKTRNIFIFEVWNMKTKTLLDHTEMMKFCADLRVDVVPVLDDNFKLPETIQEILDYSNGNSVLGTKPLREGVILRSYFNPYKTCKVKNPVYMEIHKSKKTKPVQEEIKVVL